MFIPPCLFWTDEVRASTTNDKTAIQHVGVCVVSGATALRADDVDVPAAFFVPRGTRPCMYLQ